MNDFFFFSKTFEGIASEIYKIKDMERKLFHSQLYFIQVLSPKYDFSSKFKIHYFTYLGVKSFQNPLI